MAVFERGVGASRGREGCMVAGSHFRGQELPLGLDRRDAQGSLTVLPRGTRGGGSESPRVWCYICDTTQVERD